MDTKKVFSNGPQKKGGKDSTKVILTAAGATTVGAAAGAGAAVLMDGDDKVEEPVETDIPQQTAGEQTAEETHTTQQQSSTTQQQSSTPEPEEIQPVSSQTSENQNTENGGGNGSATDNTNGGGIVDDVDPDLIAQEITAIEVDPNDVDVADMIEIDEVGTLYAADGSEMTAAAIHTADGGQYLMVDVDNDMTFDVITDMEGNPIVQVDSNLTFSDVEDMMDETGGELAYNADRDEQELVNGEDPEDGILDTLMESFDNDEYLLADNTEEESDIECADDDTDLALADSLMDDDLV